MRSGFSSSRKATYSDEAKYQYPAVIQGKYSQRQQRRGTRPALNPPLPTSEGRQDEDSHDEEYDHVCDQEL